jgi:hypothetical protein
LVALASRAIPRPDLTLVLVAGAQQLSQRKGELSVGESELLVEEYRLYSTRPGSVQITTENSVSHAIRQAAQQIHGTLATRTQAGHVCV